MKATCTFCHQPVENPQLAIRLLHRRDGGRRYWRNDHGDAAAVVHKGLCDQLYLASQGILWAERWRWAWDELQRRT
jgi:hypothetical protein